MDKLPNKLKELRKKKGWSQARLAERIHIDRTTYCKYENGTVTPPVDICIYLCIVLDSNPNELFGWGQK